MAKSYAEHFQNAFHDKDVDFNMGYVKTRFDIFAFCNGSLSKDLKNRNVISRVRNNLVEAINLQTILPKYLIIVLENDLIKAANHYTDGFTDIMNSWISWLANKFHRIISAHKEKLPTKARKFKYPHIFWIPAVHHMSYSKSTNHYRQCMNTCIHDETTRFREFTMLMLHSWDPRDFSLINKDGNMTHRGKAQFWDAVDSMVQKFDQDQLNVQQRIFKGPPAHPQ